MNFKSENPPVKGNNEPYIIIKGQRIKLTKDEAREASVKFYAEIIKKEFGVFINFVSHKAEIKKVGDYLFTLKPVQGGNTQAWALTFKVDNGVYVIEEEFPKASSGVSHRQLFGSLMGELRRKDRYEEDFEDKSSIIFFTNEEWQEKMEKYNQDRKDTAEERAKIKEVTNTFLNNFPRLFAGKYRQNIRFIDKSSPNSGTLTTLICPLPDGDKEYSAYGHSKKQAHIQAMAKAFADNILA